MSIATSDVANGFFGWTGWGKFDVGGDLSNYSVYLIGGDFY